MGKMRQNLEMNFKGESFVSNLSELLIKNYEK